MSGLDAGFDPAVSRVWSAATQAAGRELGDLAKREASLASWCTYRVGGPAALMVNIESQHHLQLVASAIRSSGVEVLIVGKGSNLLVSDRGFDGLAIHLGDGFSEMSVDGVMLDAGGAAMLPVVARFSARNGLAGFEWAVGVPGTVGGAVRMNAGGHGSDIASCLVEATVLDLQSGNGRGEGQGQGEGQGEGQGQGEGHGEIAKRTVDQLGFGYRRSIIGDRSLVISARFELQPGDVAASEAKLSEIVQWRRANQPGGPNAGSVFANPDGDSAGRLIDQAGLKGLRVGSAVVSDKHANFIQADPNGSADDVYALIRAMQAKILETQGLLLRAENRLVGFDEYPDLKSEAKQPGPDPESQSESEL